MCPYFFRKTVFGNFTSVQGSFWEVGSKEQTHCSAEWLIQFIQHFVDNRWEIANYKALTWIKCTLQLVVMEPLNDLLNSLKSPSLCKAIHLSWADIKRKTWFFYKLKNKAARMWWWQAENKKREKKRTCLYAAWQFVFVCVSMCMCFFCLCTFDIYLCGLSKSNLPCCYWIQTNRRCGLKYCCNTESSI